jgi:hypothetical protein
MFRSSLGFWLTFDPLFYVAMLFEFMELVLFSDNFRMELIP